MCFSICMGVHTHRDETLSAVYVKISKLIVSLRFYTAEYISLFLQLSGRLHSMILCPSCHCQVTTLRIHLECLLTMILALVFPLFLSLAFFHSLTIQYFPGKLRYFHSLSVHCCFLKECNLMYVDVANKPRRQVRHRRSNIGIPQCS